MPRGEEERERAADRDARERHVAEVELVEKALDGRSEEGSVVASRGNVGIAMAGIVEGIDGEMLGKLRHDLLKQVELRPKRMEKDKHRALAGFDVAELVAPDLDGLNGDRGRPGELRRRFRLRPQRFDEKGDQPDADPNRYEDDQCAKKRMHGGILPVGM